MSSTSHGSSSPKWFKIRTPILRKRTDISHFYKTPVSGSRMNHFKRRKLSGDGAAGYFNGIDPQHPPKLPLNVMLRIFYYLNKKDLVNMMLTCRRCSETGKHPAFWQFLDIGGKFILESALQLILDRRLKILRLHSATIEAPILSSWYKFPGSVAQLTHLDMSQVKLEVGILFNILHRCSNLRALSLEYCEVLDDACCDEIAKNSALEYLDLLYAKRTTPGGIEKILGSCRVLTELNIGWTELSPGSLDSVSALLPPSLRRLNLSGMGNLIKDSHVKTICRGCSNLVDLDLSDNTAITGESFDWILILRCLKILTLSRCYEIDPNKFLIFGNEERRVNIPAKLRELNVFDCVADTDLTRLRVHIHPVMVNASMLSTAARPTVGSSISSIWGQRTRDLY